MTCIGKVLRMQIATTPWSGLSTERDSQPANEAETEAMADSTESLLGDSDAPPDSGIESGRASRLPGFFVA